MAMPHLSYDGSCTYGGTFLFCTDMSFTPATQPTFNDHTVGLLQAPLDDNGVPIQRRIYHYPPNAYKVAVSGHITDTAPATIMNSVLNGTANTMQMVFWDGGDMITVDNVYLSSLTININAGEATTFSLEGLGLTSTVNTGSSDSGEPCAKLLTWDRAFVSSANFFSDNNMASFSLTIQNNLVNIPTTKTGSPSPIGGPASAQDLRAIRIGMQQITGNLSLYEFAGSIDQEDDLTLTMDNTSWMFHVAYAAPSARGSGSNLFMSTINFFGTANEAAL